MYYVSMEEVLITEESITFVPNIPNKKNEEKKNKYNILETLVILSAIAVVVILILLIINPNKAHADARNTQRSADVSSILSNVSAYIQKSGSIPSSIPISDKCSTFGSEICKTGPFNCTDLVNMSFLGTNSIMPKDPSYTSINGTGYYIYKNNEGVITVCAPYAERNEEISFSKDLY